MNIVRKQHRLAVRWDRKEQDTLAEVSPRFSGGDMSWILWKMFNSENLQELKDRGYDLSSMRFRIDKTPEAILEHEKRAGRA